MKIGDVVVGSFVSVRTDASLPEVARALLASKGAAVVLAGDGSLAGIVTAPDLLPEGSAAHGPARAMRVLRDGLEGATWRDWATGRSAADVMRPAAERVEEDDDPTEVGRRMLESDLRYVPVMRGRTVSGILTRPDLLRLLRSHDLTLRKNVERMLWRCQFTPPSCTIDVEVDGGIVLLEGEVSTAADVRVVGSLIAGLDGVARVDNMLTVRADRRVRA